MSKPTVVGKVCEPYVTGGNVRRHTKIITGPLSYTTGGDALTAKELGDTWLIPHIPPCISLSGDRIAYFVFAEADKVITVKMLITDVAGLEVANASDQTTKKFVVPVDGIG